MCTFPFHNVNSI